MQKPRLDVGGGVAGKAVAFADHRGGFGSTLACTKLRRLHHHVGKPGMEWQAHHGAAVGGDGMGGIDGTQLAEQVLRLPEGRLWRCFEPGQAIARGDAPVRHVEGKRGKIGNADFRCIMGGECLGFGFRPEAVAVAGPEASGTALALFGAGLAHADGFERRHAGSRVEARRALEAGVDHRLDSFDGERGFGDGGGEHDLAAARVGLADRLVLVGKGERTIKRAHVSVGGEIDFAEGLHRAADFAFAREEHEQASLHLAEGAGDGFHRVVDQAEAGGALEMGDVYRKHAAGGLDEGRVAEMRTQRFGIERCRHHEDLEVGPETPLHIEGEGKAEVAIEAALMEFVEDDEAGVGKFRVLLQAAGEDAFGDDLDPGAGRDLALESHGVAHRVAHAFTECGGHAPGRGAGSEAARFEHDDLLARKPRRIPERQRHAGGLAGAGFCHQNGCCVGGEACGKIGDDAVDGKIHGAGLSRVRLRTQRGRC